MTGGSKMDLLGKLASILAAGSMILSGALDEAAPQHDADGLLFLVNRQYRISDAFTPDGKETHRALLEAEGIPFTLDGRVDLALCLWDGE